MRYNLTIILFTLFGLSASTAQIIYTCDFEDEAENALWDLENIINYTLPYVNFWHIDRAINNGGEKSMYISTDGGQTPGFSSGSMMISTREIPLDPGDYELSFDFLTGAAGGADALFVAWVPVNVNTYSATNYAKPAFLSQYGLSSSPSIPVGEDSLQSASWRTSVFPIKNHDGTPHKLTFVWMNSTNNNSSVKGACVDNILIAPEGLCDAPEDLQLSYQDNAVVFSWSGDAPIYEVKYYSYETERWVTIPNISANQIILYNITEGIYDFYVRSICNTHNSHWTSQNMLVYLAALRCIDYLNLTDNNCWIGTTNYNKESRKKVDYGSDSKLSRHTVHMTQDEFDPRTGNMLPTIPPGELASIRLGNWATGGEAECIEYSYTVDAKNAAVLMLKYAVVLEEPGGNPHDKDHQSSFTLEILRGNTKIPCAQAEFSANYDTSGDDTWHEAKSGVWWKEWTTIGVNLEQYDGETLTVRVTTRDCSLGGHYGYAYFTLGCSDGQMDGIACGDNPTTEFIAPEGFNYRWYLPDNPGTTLSTDRYFDVDPMDTLTYYCDIIFPKDVNCYFTLTASALPRYPVPEASYDVSHDDCKNTVIFDNNSHVMTVNPHTSDSTHTVTACDWIEWDFGDGRKSNEYHPRHDYPLTGGSYTVKLIAGISDCIDSIEFVINLPQLGSTFDTIFDYSCFGQSYILPSGARIWGSGTYNDTIPSAQYDCYDVYIYKLTFMEDTNVEIYDTICSGESYYFDGEDRISSGTYKSEKLSIYGCDSITTLHLTVIESVEILLESDNFIVCAEYNQIEIPYMVNAGRVSNYSLNILGIEPLSGIATSPIVIPINEILPGTYPGELVFYDEDCGNNSLEVTLNIYYSESIITQRWNDVLGILNKNYNGGYEFTRFQWYRNGEPLEGETKSYLFIPEGLSVQDEYSALVTRLEDDVMQFTCGFIPVALDAELTLVQNTVQANMTYSIQSNEEGIVRLYSMTGSKISEEKITAGNNELRAPGSAGYYLLQIQTEEQKRTYHLHVTQ